MLKVSSQLQNVPFPFSSTSVQTESRDSHAEFRQTTPDIVNSKPDIYIAPIQYL